MVKTRFAPSPTGYLHIGGARTALFNYIYAKHFGGRFILRIEDTDLERSLKAYEEDIIKSMQWLGLVSDEPVLYQSQRLDIYKEYCKKLLDEGKAYNCYCTAESLEEDKNKLIAEGKKPMYSGKCRNLSDEEQNLNLPHVVRFKTDRSGGGKFTKFKDLIRDQSVSVNHSEIDDFVIMRTDGIPTYNFAVVIDDALMGITHIIRGDDHLSNTPKQVLLYEALGFEPPAFAHVSMILGNDGKRLSKRHGATAVTQYKNDGFLPEALINYLVRLGWSHGNDEILSLDEMIQYFDLKHISKSAGVFNKEKLLWLNAHYIKQKTAEELVSLINDININNINNENNNAEKGKINLKPVLKWVTHIAQVKIIPANHPIGYGLTYITKKNTKIAVVPQGYFDGLTRTMSNNGEFLIKGKKAKILGRVAMNMTVVDVSNIKDVIPGDEVVIIGAQGKIQITAEDVAKKMDTINYEVTTKISALLPRIIA